LQGIPYVLDRSLGGPYAGATAAAIERAAALRSAPAVHHLTAFIRHVGDRPASSIGAAVGPRTAIGPDSRESH